MALKKTTKAGAAPIQRNTQQLRAVYGAFAAEDRPLSPSEALRLATRQCPGLGLTTVYRLIKKLQADGQLMAVGLINKAPRYETTGRVHHHHFHCSGCDRTFDLKPCRLKLSDLVPPGFTIHAHEMVLEGTCVGCSRDP